MDAISTTGHLQNMSQLLDLTLENCVGQGYDGASVMTGKDCNVQALLNKSGYKFANYFHCVAHRLVSAWQQQQKLIKNFIT